MSATTRPVVPPEEKFWQRYSPHNEFPLSTVGSITIYLLIGLLIVAGIQLHLFEPKPNPPLAWDTLGPVGDDPNGGNPGDARPPRDGAPGVPAVAPSQPAPAALPTPGKPDPLDLPPDDSNDPLAKEYPNLFTPLPGPRPMTKTGTQPGRPGGDPNGGDGGDGGNGLRAGTPTARPAPQRWNIVFNVQSGEEYRRQLEGMGAILVIPAAEGQFRVIRNLTPPVRSAIEDPRTLSGIGWRDDRPQSVANLAGALGLPEPPPYVFAFFPPEVETKLRKLEQDFAQRAGRPQIKLTNFTVTLNRRTNQYEMVVTDQR